GVQSYFEQQMQALGSNFVTVRPASSIGLSGLQVTDESLESYLFNSVRRLPYIDDATAARMTFGTIKYMGNEEAVVVIGAEAGYLQAKNREMILGDSLVPQDRFNAVMGDSVLTTSSLGPVPLMSQFELTLNVDGVEVTERFRVKGTVVDPQAAGPGAIYVPIRTLNDMLGKEGYTEITLFAADVDRIDTVKKQTTDMLDRLLQVEPDRQLNTSEEEELFEIFLPFREGAKKEYSITTQSDVLGITEDITGMIQLALVAIASISLLVGGIGIANVMLATVAERTREIGVMKAVGAKNRHVLTLFLFEAAVVGFTGGVLGLSIAAAATYTLVPLLMGVPGSLPMQWAVIALCFSVGIGLVSGLYPAIRASSMDPVQALRSE
ncbi:MAG: ABC transporter permease, partial [Dehalococcoidia bacterium]